MHQLLVKGIFFCLVFLATSAKPIAETFAMNNKNSEVSFSGEHAGMAFSGIFEKWQATLVLPPSAEPKIIAEFQLDSAKTGDFTYDSTLLEGDWFDAANYPLGIFKSTQLSKVDKGFEVEGTLTLRGISNPQTFTLVESKLGFTAKLSVDRLAYKIGFDSDPNAEWVSREIIITLNLVK